MTLILIHLNNLSNNFILINITFIDIIYIIVAFNLIVNFEI